VVILFLVDFMKVRALVSEFIGTFFLVLIIGLVVIDSAMPAGFAPLAIGFGLMGLIFAGGHLSKAQYNPAVTLSFFLHGTITLLEAVGFWVVQVVGAMLAAGVVAVFKPNGFAGGMEVVFLPAFLAEFLFTFALVYVIHNVALAQGTVGNMFYGVAIGGIVIAGIFAVGDISGASFNPAVSVAGAIMHLFQWQTIWIHFTAQILGAIVATYTFKLAHLGD
jgi:aquaporin Z